MIQRFWSNLAAEFRKAYSERGSIPFLDGLRGCAAMLVFVGHCFPVERLGNPELAVNIQHLASYGVTLFFILSGFLIASYFWNLRLKKATDYRMGDYFRRRTLRVLPLFYFSSAGFFLLYIALSRDFSVLGSVPYYLLTVQNFFTEVNLINPPTWSVAVEIHFYIVVALLFWMLRKASARTVLMAVSGVVLGCAAYKSWAFGQVFHGLADERAFLYANSLARMDTFAFGILIAGVYAYHRAGRNLRQQRGFLAGVSVLTVLGVLACIYAGAQVFHVLLEKMVWGGWGEMLTALLFGLVVVLGLWKRAGVHRIFDNALMRYWGKISYSLYLLHLPLYTWIYHPAMNKLGFSPWVAFFSFFVGMHFVSFLSFVLVEKPFLKVKKRFQQAPAEPALAGTQTQTSV